MHMRLSLVTLLAVSLAMSGCIANMGEFKQFLGVTKPPPAVLPPLAKAQASATVAPVDAPIHFSSDGTRDPLGLALTYTWAFGDGTSGNGASTTHAYSKPGDYVARLVVLNARGAADEATVTVQITPTNRLPVAAILATPEHALMGEPVAFDASRSTDPEAMTLTFAWDFGDGGTSHEALPTHAFAAPGLHVVKLTVTDALGGAGSTTLTLPVDGEWRESGKFEVADSASKRSVPIVVAEGASTLVATLTFDAGLAGTNDLTLVVKDASGREVGEAAKSSSAPGLGGDATATLTLSQDVLSRQVPGAWSVEVVRGSSPASVAWSLVVTEILRDV